MPRETNLAGLKSPAEAATSVGATTDLEAPHITKPRCYGKKWPTPTIPNPPHPKFQKELFFLSCTPFGIYILWLMPTILIMCLDAASSALVQPVLAVDFNVPMSIAQWSSSIFYIANAASGLVCSKLSDTFGPCTMMVIWAFLLGVSCLGAAFSPNIYLFLVARFVSGVATAALIATRNCMTRVLSLPSQGMRNFMMFTVINTMINIVCPLLIGLAVDALGWRVVYILIGCLGFIASVGAFFTADPYRMRPLFRRACGPSQAFPASGPVALTSAQKKEQKQTRAQQRFDWAGAISLTLAVGCFCSSFSFIAQHMYWVALILFCVFSVCLVLFVLAENRNDRIHRLRQALDAELKGWLSQQRAARAEDAGGNAANGSQATKEHEALSSARAALSPPQSTVAEHASPSDLRRALSKPVIPALIPLRLLRNPISTLIITNIITSLCNVGQGMILPFVYQSVYSCTSTEVGLFSSISSIFRCIGAFLSQVLEKRVVGRYIMSCALFAVTICVLILALTMSTNAYVIMIVAGFSGMFHSISQSILFPTIVFSAPIKYSGVVAAFPLTSRTIGSSIGGCVVSMLHSLLLDLDYSGSIPAGGDPYYLQAYCRAGTGVFLFCTVLYVFACVFITRIGNARREQGKIGFKPSLIRVLDV